MILNEQQSRSFTDRGYLVVKNFYDNETMNTISNWLNKLEHKQPAMNQEAKYYEKSTLTGENILVRIEHVLGWHNTSCSKLLLNEKTIDYLTELLGEPPLLFKDKVNYKLPGCRADKLHQDQAAGWNAYTDYFVTMCIAVDENRKENAAISFMSSGNYEMKLMTPEWKPLSEDDPPYQPEDQYTLMEVDPGDVIFFDCYIPHGSPANTSDKSRRNIFLTFNRNSAGDLREKYYADKWAIYPPNQGQRVRSEDSFLV